MCGILASLAQNTNLAPYIAANATRGRDSYGFWTSGRSFRFLGEFHQEKCPDIYANKAALANCRAEPTTEWVNKKTKVDVQPFEVGDWVIVHNGTIANDKELCRQYEFNPPTRIDSWVIAALLHELDDFPLVINKLRGSFAICAVNKREPDVIHFAMNYRPLYLHDENTLSSVQLNKRDMLLTPYSIGILTQDGVSIWPLRDKPSRSKALAVCSGGLDSTVAATALLRVGMEVELLHFSYGCRATRQEAAAVRAIAQHLKIPFHIVETPIFTQIIKGSSLTNTERNMPFAEGEKGAEYAHEWVPARNLIMLSIAIGIAESRGFNVLALGANLEEAGAFPDNEQAFYDCFSRLLPFAVADGVQLRLVMPVVTKMKHEIVKLGLEVNAPMHLTWSCYNDSPQHCGNCGPCFMRKTAFKMNGQEDPVFLA